MSCQNFEIQLVSLDGCIYMSSCWMYYSNQNLLHYVKNEISVRFLVIMLNIENVQLSCCKIGM